MVLPLLLPPVAPARLVTDEEPAGRTRVTVLDVGQGTAVIIRSGDRTLVYDTGGGDPAGANMATTVLLPWLRRQGVNELDTLVISHPDNDHSAGAGTLLAALPVGRLYRGGQVPGLAGGRPCVAGQAWRWPGGQTFRFLSPAGSSTGSSNDNSCVLQIAAAGHRLLLAGDVESAVERDLVRYWGDALASDWLLVAHHGSRTSSTYALLKTVRPATAVISSGYANRFGHPHPDVVETPAGHGRDGLRHCRWRGAGVRTGCRAAAAVSQLPAAKAALLDVNSAWFSPFGRVRIMAPSKDPGEGACA